MTMGTRSRTDDDSSAVSPYHAKLEKWTSRELQLNTLHEEIILKREALLRTSRNLIHGATREDAPLSDDNAVLRNERLIADLSNLDANLTESGPPLSSPRFATLQTNYWSMVTNMFPIWQKSMDDAIPTKEGNLGATVKSKATNL